MEAAGRRLAQLQSHLTFWEDILDGPLEQRRCAAGGAAAAAAAAGAGPVVLIGGMVMDLQAHPSGIADVQRGGSVPGRVTQSAGGVARNVAEALALLLRSGGAPASRLPLLVSAVGDDLAGRALLLHWESLGLSTACIARLPGGATPTVSVVFDLGGEVAACVADVGLLERELAPLLLRTAGVAAALAAAPVLMLDGNLSEAALQEACCQAAAAGVPVWFEPVSVPKSTRAASLLSCITFASPNGKELAAIAAAARQQQGGGCSGGNALLAKPAASHAEAALHLMLPDIATLLLAGVRHLVLTLGVDGAALCTLAPGGQAVEVVHVPALPATVVNCSGAGDCLVAGCLFGLAQGVSAAEALCYGVAAATAAVQSQSNVPTGLDAAAARVAANQARAKSAMLSLALPEGCCGCCSCHTCC
ncbi:hypothetical protein ABPG75_005862 [Micractinium tetrahymenae]